VNNVRSEQILSQDAIRWFQDWEHQLRSLANGARSNAANPCFFARRASQHVFLPSKKSITATHPTATSHTPVIELFLFEHTTPEVFDSFVSFSERFNDLRNAGKSALFILPYACDAASPPVLYYGADPLRVQIHERENGVDFSEFGLTETASHRNKLSLSFSHLIPKIESLQNLQMGGYSYLANFCQTLFFPQDFPLQNLPLTYTLQRYLQSSQRFGCHIVSNALPFNVVVASPERFLHCSSEGELLTEPIKGTAAGTPPWEPLCQVLWDSKKEWAEQTLVTDLLRNDLNSICKPGTVEVKNARTIHIQNGLLQMQTSICGKLAGHSLPWGKILPAGSISGAPKIKTVQILSNLEEVFRGYYTGVSGVLLPTGEVDSVVNIRSLYQDSRGTYTGVGAGITTLSEPQKEIEELQVKAKKTFSHWGLL
jgi:anthranilate/para-aminobenzoate synthase component I